MILLFAALFRITLLVSPPMFSDDLYRYVWDGRIQSNGINPFKYPPSAPELAEFRDGGAMMRWYQAYGGTGLTATTEQEYMNFDIILPVERVDLFLRVEADRMSNTVFREFEQERMILVEQRIGDLNNSSTPYYEQLNALSGIVHPVFWPEGYSTDFDE